MDTILLLLEPAVPTVIFFLWDHRFHSSGLLELEPAHQKEPHFGLEPVSILSVQFRFRVGITTINESLQQIISEEKKLCTSIFHFS